ncbi:uncharacterized protein LOC133892203 [Phragmites australis]|uniref:uncharacterized protein LOC133892203 n=1 Tax=Phragmites australis TaxID=29695 RepID=UPI002D798C60|nr:uncharacterized protein LOC133892203 [Phragmites australis]
MDLLLPPLPSLRMPPTPTSLFGEEEAPLDEVLPTSSDFGISPPGSPSSDDEVWDEFIDDPPRAKKARMSLSEEEDKDKEEDNDDADADANADDSGDANGDSGSDDGDDNNDDSDNEDEDEVVDFHSWVEFQLKHGY